MDRDTLRYFTSLFEEQKSSILFTGKLADGELNISRDEMKDDVDFSSSELQQEMKLRLRTREALYLKKVEGALQRIKSGSFGECDGCGDDIELRRLKARPITTLCLSCKEEEEKREQVYIDGHLSKSLGRSRMPLPA